MKAEINENGVMRVTPETPTEAYALRRWADEAWVTMKDTLRMEDGYWRGSNLITDSTVSKSPKE